MVADEVDVERLEGVLRAILIGMDNFKNARQVDRLADVIFSLPDIDQHEKVIVASRVLRYGEPDPVALVVEYLMKILLGK